MTTDAAQNQQAAADPGIRVAPPRVSADLSTILGLISAVGLIIAAIAMGSSNANFLNGPSFLIVVLGTMAATAVSYTWAEIKHVPGILGNTMIRRYRAPSDLAIQLMDIASVARKKGLLSL